jgi:uncharacterized protein (TIGR00251 family)
VSAARRSGGAAGSRRPPDAPAASPAALTIDVQVVPRASRTAVGGAVGDRLRVAVTAPPVDGAANAAVVAALAAAFEVRTRDVEIVRGETGRRKTVRIAGASEQSLARLRRGG